MPTVTIAAEDASDCTIAAAPIIETRERWSDKWQEAPDIILESATLTASADDLPSATFHRRYGAVKDFVDDAVGTYEPKDYAGHWVRISLLSGEERQTIWTGRIANDPRVIYGSDVVQSGKQEFVAYGPLSLLRKIDVRRSWFYDGSESNAVDWLVPMNGGPWKNRPVGNRSETRSDRKVYEYEGNTSSVGKLWSCLTYADYLLARFVNLEGEDYPSWTLAGDLGGLDLITTVIDFGKSVSVADALRKLISPQLGFDFYVRAFSEQVLDEDGEPKLDDDDQPILNEGFQVVVFRLTTKPVSIGGIIVDGNSDSYELRPSEAPGVISCRITSSSDHVYDHIAVIGERILSCFSVQIGDGLSEGWLDASEVEYIAASKDGRLSDKLRDVFSLFVIPTDYKFASGANLPRALSDGTIVTGAAYGTYPALPYQSSNRRLERFLPLREGVDYREGRTIADSDKTDQASDLLPPQAWFYDPLESDWTGEGQWVNADSIGVDVSVATEHAGLYLRGKPPHWIAHEHVAGIEYYEGEHPAAYDYGYMVATIAMRTDQRIVAQWWRDEALIDTTLPETKVIYAKDCELWVSCPYTVLGPIDGANTYYSSLETTGPNYTILRDDREKLNAILAAAVERYGRKRTRGDVTFQGLLPYQDLVGAFLTVIEEGESDTTHMSGAITAVQWVNEGRLMTIVKAGYAE